MALALYNDLTRKKEPFVPLHEGKVAFYSCGPTVYDYFHIGNARPFIVFDVLRRYLEFRGYEVTFVQNFTDIDDKMIARATATASPCSNWPRKPSPIITKTPTRWASSAPLSIPAPPSTSPRSSR